jgi:hypothetical protein
MTLPEYWAALVAKNPLLKGTLRLTVSPDKIKAMIAEAHAAGRASAQAESDLFKDLFRR